LLALLILLIFPSIEPKNFGSLDDFRSDIFAALGGFKVDLGFKCAGLIQGEEVEICKRMRQRFGRGVIYNPKAVVFHKVCPER
jgi:hypothetical protein